MHLGAMLGMMKRAIEDQLRIDVQKKMVLLAGPRQVGKTTLSKSLVAHHQYLNFDDSDDRKIILKKAWDRTQDLVILDELHKKPKWKSWIKGIYDTEGNKPSLLITGSARLDIHRKGGDSLAGRHFLHRLHPLSLAELRDQVSPTEALETILKVGGFPEPFLNGEEAYAKRWRSSHLDRILREDLIDLEPVRQIKSIEILVDLLSDRVGSPISYANLARDLEVSPHSVKKWIGLLEMLYVVFVVPPFSRNMARALLKESKIYFYDIGRIENNLAARFENVVALSLLKDLHMREDALGERNQLYYLRDKEKREVDFLTLVDRKIESLVEVKVSDDSVSKSLVYFKERLHPKRTFQIVKDLKKEQTSRGIQVQSATKFLTHLEMR